MHSYKYLIMTPCFQYDCVSSPYMHGYVIHLPHVIIDLHFLSAITAVPCLSPQDKHSMTALPVSIRALTDVPEHTGYTFSSSRHST